MLKKILIPFLTVFFFLTAGGSRGEAFVPQTPHLLYLMVSKIKKPSGLEVHQVRHVPGSESAAEGSAEAVEGPAQALPAASLQETLRYLFPGKLRAEINSPAASFFVVSEGDAVRVEDGRVVGAQISAFDCYTDILLYRDYDQLALKLDESGVNTQKVTFQRLGGRICYFIGQPPVDGKENPGLWIDKESFFPVRYLLQKGKWMVDVHYEDWQRVSRTWYPMSVRILVDGRVFAEITAGSVELAAGFASNLFDVNRILRKFPRAEDAGRVGYGHEERIRTLDKEVEEFNKLYD